MFAHAIYGNQPQAWKIIQLQAQETSEHATWKFKTQTRCTMDKVILIWLLFRKPQMFAVVNTFVLTTNVQQQ